VPRVELRGLVKRFGSTVALDGAEMSLDPGEVHALLGENGAGKTTLVRALYGLIRPDAGEIRWDGRPVEIRSPADALDLGIGLVHQHSLSVPALSVAENLVLGDRSGFWLPRSELVRRARRLLERYALPLDPDALARELPVAHQQRLEIVRALDRGARVLILDEPTAVLAPSEVRDLLALLAQLREEGRTVVFISHKLEEVTAVCDRVTVLRSGRTVGSRGVQGLRAEELAGWMVGPDLPPTGRPPEADLGPPALRGVELHAGVLDGIDFEVRGGEIFAIAGIDGNGQGALEEVLAGVRSLDAGRVEILNPPLGLISGDRHRTGLILGLSTQENLVLPRSAGAGDDDVFRHGLLRADRLRAVADEAIEHFAIQGRPEALAATLSGGNQQKVGVARALRPEPGVLVAVNPTRGLDVASTAFIRDELRGMARGGAAVLLVSTDLDEILELGNRIAVLFRGALLPVDPDRSTREQIGELMLGRAA
jgi:simple sugar transport system ATP-binding protein